MMGLFVDAGEKGDAGGCGVEMDIMAVMKTKSGGAGDARGTKRRFLLKRMLLIPLGIVAFAATLVAQADPAWAEVYARTVYPALSSVVAFLPSLAGFSVAEWLAAALALFCLGYAVFFVRRLVGSKGERGMVAYRGAMGALALCCAVYFGFATLCGVNYYRYTFAEHAGYDLEQADVEPAERQEDLKRLTASLADELGRVRAELGEGVDLYQAAPGDFERYASQSVAAMRALAHDYPALDRPLFSRPKPVLASELLSSSNIAGIFIPFTMESNVATTGPFFSLPATMAHELAHQSGFMREDEANFISYLACKKSDEPLMRYSGLLLAYENALSALRKTDAEAASEVATGLSEAVQRDLAQRAEFLARYQDSAMWEASTAANNAYLKANRQTDGVQSYGRMVDLLLAEQRAAKESGTGAGNA